MLRKDKEITDRTLINKVINNAMFCHIGLSNNNYPYIIPVSFGYDGSNIYFHTAPEGKKLDYIKSNKQACFALEHEVQLVTNNTLACSWSFSFFSVIGFGSVEEITKTEEMDYALNQIMQHYSGKNWSFSESSFAKVRLWRIIIEEVSGKMSKDKILV